VAIKNSIAGIVRESFEAMKTESFEQVETMVLQINHCLFIKKGTKPESINRIISHEMALKQCDQFITTHYPQIEINSDIGDTALAAIQLANGTINNDTAVICSKEAGISNKLKLVHENIQNRQDNFTEFRLFKIRTINDKLSLWNKALLLFYSDDKPEVVFKIIFVLLIMLLFTLQNYFPHLNSLPGAWFLGGIVSAIFVIISNKTWRSRFYLNFVKGYWTYQVIRDGNDINNAELPAVPRIVEIDLENGRLKFSIFIADRSSREFAKSINSLHSDLGKQTGQIVYWYEVSDKPTARSNFNGLVYLDWKKRKKWTKITQMTARYLGEETKNQGYVNYNRISKKEYEKIKCSEYVNFEQDQSNTQS